MSKRANQFERMDKDFYPTPFKAVEPLAPFLFKNEFVEPCAGNGDLIRHLGKFGKKCVGWNDSNPEASHQGLGVDAAKLPISFYNAPAITNPPWSRKLLTPLLDDWIDRSFSTWLLLPADYAFNLWFADYLDYCCAIVAIGRVKWIEDSPYSGKDNCAWYRFTNIPGAPTLFHGRRTPAIKKRQMLEA